MSFLGQPVTLGEILAGVEKIGDTSYQGCHPGMLKQDVMELVLAAYKLGHTDGKQEQAASTILAIFGGR